jgi:hypothetical protein
LAEYPQERNCELVYMGIVPEARGFAHGVEIVRFAQWITGKLHQRENDFKQKSAQNAKHTAMRMVLAVDAANSPAIATYASAGFQTWDRRGVFLREIAEKNNSLRY